MLVAFFGGSGKVGKAALRILERRGFSVRALCHRTPVGGERVELVQGSVTDPDAVEKVVAGTEIVVQMATTKEDPETFFDVSIKGTFHILEACRRHGVRQLLLMGGDASMGIWFSPQPQPIDETHPLTAYPGYYAFSKVVEEVMTGQYHIQYGLPHTILRSSWVFEGADLLHHFSLLKNVDPEEKGHGFGEVPDEVLALVRSGQERIPILIDAEGKPLRRHIVHIDDVMQAFDRMIDQPKAFGKSFNIAGPSAFEYREAAEYLSQKTGIASLELACPEYHSFEINIDRARRELGYEPVNDIFRMIDRALDAAGATETEPPAQGP